MPGTVRTPAREAKRTKTSTGRQSKQSSTLVRRNAFTRGTPGFARQRDLVYLGLGFPAKVMVKHKYVETVSLTSTLGSLATYLFRANSLFDPNSTGTGHQPMYYDQLAAIYSYYQVIASKITVKFGHDDAANSAVTCSLSMNEDATVTSTNIDNIIEYGEAKSCTLGSSTTDVYSLGLNYTQKRRWGTNSLGDARFIANISSSPSEITNFQINCQSTDRASTTLTNAEVEIEFTTVWTDIKDIAGS